MKREELLKVYRHHKDYLSREGDNQFAYLEGSLFSLEAHESFTLSQDGDGYTLTCSSYSDNEYIFDVEVDGDVCKMKLSPDTIYVAYYRANTVTTRFDFYNNEVESGFDDMQRSKLTEYYLSDAHGNLHEIYVSEWHEDE